MIFAQVCSSGDLRARQFGAEIGFDESDGFLDTLILDVEIPRIRMPARLATSVKNRGVA